MMYSSVKQTGTGQPYSETVASTGINGLTTGFPPFINDAARLLSSDRTSSRDQVRENNIDTAIPEICGEDNERAERVDKQQIPDNSC